MEKTYFILLQNNYLLPVSEKPIKKGSYLAGVRLFETAKTTTCSDLCNWIKNKYTLKPFREIEDWE